MHPPIPEQDSLLDALRLLSLRDPVVKAGLMYFDDGSLPLARVMLLMVEQLVLRSEAQHRSLVHAMERRPVQIVLPHEVMPCVTRPKEQP